LTKAADRASSWVLLADDNPHVLQMYRFAIEKLATRRGIEVAVETAADGRVALDLLETRRFDLLITDLYMPVLDGFALIEKVRADGRLAGMRVLAITAGDPGDAARSGADQVLRKPVQFEHLANAIAALLVGTPPPA
jgi:CheY-like chemotaxis protein